MARYTNKDANGHYYIESANGKLESDIKGHTYGEAIDRFAKLENADVAREIITKFKTKMHSEIARNELLAEYGDDFYEGRIDASLTAIDLLAEIAMEYCSNAQNEGIDV
jgi:hypothetical protein